MTKLIELKGFKQSKKDKLILDDLDQILLIYGLAIKGLSFYSKYIPVSESILQLKENKRTLDLFKKKYKLKVDDKQ